MRRIHVTLSLLASLCSGLQAQTAIMRANIPFDFQFGKTQMPAGEYKVQYASGSHVLWLYETHTNKAAAALTTPASRSETSDNGVLRFNHYGDEYFFAGVWASQAREGSTVPRSAREKELASRVRKVEPTVVALRK